jgi:uncharacterized protein
MATVGALACSGGDAARLGAIVRRAPLLMRALRAAREVDAPDWLISADAIRDAVWDHLHGWALTATPRDVDLAFFDPADVSPEREHAVQGALSERAPALPWQASNQAAVHLWYPQRFGLVVEPFASSVDAVATFPEIDTCVGIRLLDDDDLARRCPARPRRPPRLRVPPQSHPRARGLLRAARGREGLDHPLAAPALPSHGRSSRSSSRSRSSRSRSSRTGLGRCNPP